MVEEQPSLPPRSGFGIADFVTLDACTRELTAGTPVSVCTDLRATSPDYPAAATSL